MLRERPKSLSCKTNLLKLCWSLWQSWTAFILRKSFISSSNIRNFVWDSIEDAKFTSKPK